MFSCANDVSMSLVYMDLGRWAPKKENGSYLQTEGRRVSVSPSN